MTDDTTSYSINNKKISITNSPSKAYYFFKRCIDIIGSLVGIVLCGIVAVPFFFIYKFEEKNKGPMLFRQRRLGKNGKTFYIYKFRSMVTDAEEVLKQNPRLYKKYIENSYKLEQDEDPRITSFGCFIRKTSLDELPQFINVFKGDMSLVGPRPIVETELKEYKEKKDKFLSVKPGITGYWQVSGRSGVNYPERVNVELYYMDHQSIWLDIKILIQTIFQVLLRKGAY